MVWILPESKPMSSAVRFLAVLPFLTPFAIRHNSYFVLAAFRPMCRRFPRKRVVVADLAIYPIPGFSDPVSSLTHLGGAGVFAVLGVALIRRGWGNTGRIAGLTVFVVCTVALLATSGVYHLLTPGYAGRAIMQRLDHAAIFGLIAGTFTPVYVLLFHGRERWMTLIFVWFVAIAGIALKMIFFAEVPEGLGTALYLGFGWVGLYSVTLLGLRYGLRFIVLLVCGAATYTAGALLDLSRWPILLPGVVGSHELFHLFVLAGVGFHWRFVWNCVTEEVSDGNT